MRQAHNFKSREATPSFPIANLWEFDEIVLLGYSQYAGWSSLVARRAHNPKVVSSNLTPATIFKTCLSTGLRDE